MTTTSPIRHAPRFVTLPGPLVRLALRMGLPFGPNVLLTVRGRTSGQPRTFPVAVVTHDGRRYVQSPFGEVNWVRNLRATPEAVLVVRGRQESVVAVELSAEEAGPVLQATLTPYMRLPLIGLFARRYFGLRPDDPPAAFLAKARQQPTFELRPAG